jgi:hypothetical protein
MFKKISDMLRKLFNGLFGGTPPPERDPFAGSLVRTRRGPNDRGSSVAVAEPDDE